MKLEKKIRVVLFERQADMMVKLLAFFEKRPDIEVVEANRSVRGFLNEAALEFKELMDRLSPDVVILDMRGALKEENYWAARIQELSFAPLIAFADRDIESALKHGGARFFEVVPRPPEDGAEEEAFRRLAFAVRRAYVHEGSGTSGGSALVPVPESGNVAVEMTHPSHVELIAMGASAGGTTAIMDVLSTLPSEMPPILVVQHITRGFSEVLAGHIDRKCLLSVTVARDGEAVCGGHVYIAPDEVHMTVEKRGGRYVLRCTMGERHMGHRPSIDLLFASVARCAGERAIGVLLTGMGRDGAEGLGEMRRAGALTIGQDEASSLIYGMPRIAFETGAVAQQLPLERIGAELAKHTSCKGEAGNE